MLGKIINIDERWVTVKTEVDLKNQANLMNIHVIFEDPGQNQKIVGEIKKISLTEVKILILGEILDGKFRVGFSKKPAFRSNVRIIVMQELELILGQQTITDNTRIQIGYSTIYQNYQINVAINDLFSNHFAVLGNTGSGKSFAVSRMIQNIFTSTNYVPVNANIFLFDAYGEYKNAFSNLNDISPMLYTKTYTTNTNYPEEEILRIPIWLLDTDDLAILLEADNPAQLSILDKALRLVPIIKGNDEQSLLRCNDIIARAILDLLRSGNDTVKISDQIKAILSTVSTPSLNLNTIIEQPGYNRPLKQCLFVDNNGKMLEMELVAKFISRFILEEVAIPEIRNDTYYTLVDLERALQFSLISEGILKSDKVFDYSNVLGVRLRSIINSNYAEYFNVDQMISKDQYINNLTHTYDQKKAQIIHFNINYVNDRMAKFMVKIISKLLFEHASTSQERASSAYHIILEEAHRYVQNDIDQSLIGYNIFDRITKEGRKYGVLLGLITQRPSELSETSISQCSNFLILRTTHPRDLKYVKEMVPNMSDEIVESLKELQSGMAIGFGVAFKVPITIRMAKPYPEPNSSNCDVVTNWYQNS